MSNEIPQAPVNSDDDQVASILEHLPVETEIDVLLPSRGIPYFGKETSVRIRPILFEDEKHMAVASSDRDYNPAQYLLGKCVEGIDPGNLILIDKLFLLLKIRELSYGKDYSVGAACKQCGFANNLNVQLDQLKVKYIPEDLDVFQIPVDLSGIKKTAIISTPISAEEHYLTNDIDQHLWRFIKSIDGNDSKTVLSKVVKKLPLLDIHTIVKSFSLEQYGVQSTVKFSCDSCDHTNVISLPIDENFFSVN
tara:strand:+ start:240 stop:989 length:750 start_codon:yes stop_codon:yes gene_type:complete